MVHPVLMPSQLRPLLPFLGFGCPLIQLSTVDRDRLGEAMKTRLWLGSSPQATNALRAALADARGSGRMSVHLPVVLLLQAGGSHLRTEAGSEPFVPRDQ